MESDRPGLNLLMIAILIGLTAFFVAVEFAMVRLRPSRVDQMVSEGRKNSLAVKKVLDNLDGYLSACQLGITITSLGLGWLGEPTVESILHPVFVKMQLNQGITDLLSFIIAFVMITYLHVVVGELAPKTIAIRKTETVALLTAHPIIWFDKVMRPFIWSLNGSANQLVKMMGIKPASEHEEAHSEEELQIIINESYENGKINKNEYGYVNRIFAFDNMQAKDILVPRTDMVCLYTDKTQQENMDIITTEQYTRFPVAQENKDNIIGIINTKQFFLAYNSNPDIEVATLIQSVMSVPETTSIDALLKKMQRESTHIAILVDEYGGTSGMVTIEDILEQIVGEIRDEFDSDEEQEITKIDDNHIIADGKVSLVLINNLLSTEFETEEWDSIGGWLYGHQSELEEGDLWQHENITFTLLEKDKHRYCKVELMVQV
ncbi:hemolysin family protein [Paenibacillus sp. FA6]|uniref:hemolysin family protein n=1 Tax=Paenibacillus sp. FA6 TaxID=3413029 RepID=UPI003F65F3E3